MFKRLFLTIISIMLFSFAVSAFEPARINPQVRRTSQYLVDIVDNVQKYHPEGKELLKPEFIEGAKNAVIKYLEAVEIKKEHKEKLINFLKNRKFNTLTQLFYLLEQFSESVEKLDILELSDVAAKGVLAVTKDPFCQIMTMEQVQKMQEALSSGQDKSIGLSLQKAEDGTFKVMFVRWNYPVYYMGLKLGDEIISINGKLLEEIENNQELEQILQADVGEKIEIVLKREGIEHPFTLAGVQENLSHPDAIGALLPGKIGYIRTDMFTMNLHTNVKKIIDELLKNEMRGLILDMRNNPGGAMPAATGLCDYFLEKGKVITITKGTYDNPLGKFAEMLIPGTSGVKVDDETTHFLAQDKKHYEFPVVILVNKQSASASEMTSGSLKSHKRAVLVGETTYGKGVGQTAIPLSSSPEPTQGGGMLDLMGGGKGMRMLYLTVMTYLLPKGENVHNEGVEPDVFVALEVEDSEIFDKIASLRSSGELVSYVKEKRERLTTKPDIFSRELIQQTKRVHQFPDSGKLIAILNKFKMTRHQDAMLRELRLATLIASQSEFSKMIPDVPFYNIVDDNQLRRGIIEMLKLLSDSHKNYPEYFNLD